MPVISWYFIQSPAINWGNKIFKLSTRIKELFRRRLQLSISFSGPPFDYLTCVPVNGNKNEII
jgi:hypothetical protein